MVDYDDESPVLPVKHKLHSFIVELNINGNPKNKAYSTAEPQTKQLLYFHEARVDNSLHPYPQTCTSLSSVIPTSVTEHRNERP